MRVVITSNYRESVHITGGTGAVNSNWEDMRRASGSDRAALLVCVEKAQNMVQGLGFRV